MKFPYIRNRGATDMIFVRIEGSNGVRWEKRVAEEQHIEKRQLGLIGGATSLLGGLLGIGNQPSTTAQPPPQTTRAPTVAPPVAAPPATTAPAVQPPATTAQPPPAVAPVPPTTIPPAAAPPATTAPPAAAPPASTAPIAIPPESSKPSSQSFIATVPIPVLSEGSSPQSTLTPAVPSETLNPDEGGETTHFSLLPSSTVLRDGRSTFTTSTLRPTNSEDPSRTNTLTEVSGSEGSRKSITTIIVSVVVIIIGSLIILFAAYRFSKRYISKRRAEAELDDKQRLVTSNNAIMSGGQKPVDSKLEKGGGGTGIVSRNF